MSRKMKRSKEKKSLKAAKKRSREVSEKISKMPTTCSRCDKVFDRADKEMIQTWMISVYNDGSSILTCSECSK